jgi:hypothetical protein
MTDQQLLHKANGIKRIRHAIKNCDLPVSEVGTMFKKRSTKFQIDLLERIISADNEFADACKYLKGLGLK